MNLFRNLRCDEIDVRRGREVGKNTGKFELLLFKTVRTDMNLLDETFGSFGWAVQYKEEKGILFCGLGIFDKASNTWVWRWNSGSESNFEAEKSVASDSMKRAGFLFGLGRELYTAPRIVIKPRSEFEQYSVSEISYDKNNRINHIKIINDEERVVFKWDLEKENERKDELRAFCDKMYKNATTDAERKEVTEFFHKKVRLVGSLKCTIKWLWDNRNYD